MTDKDSLRKELLKKRDDIPPEVRKCKDALILGQLSELDEIKQAETVLLFASFRSEADTRDLTRRLLGEGKRAVFPRVDSESRGLLLYEVKGIDELKAGYMGIPEPSLLSGDRTVDINGVDVVIIPGAGFDSEGNRIGYGGGYYDRLLSSLTRDIPVVAPAYEEQVVESVPSEPHDIKVDIIVTERRVIRVRREPAAS